jgi:hypothetical protein
MGFHGRLPPRHRCPAMSGLSQASAAAICVAGVLFG